MSSERSRAQWSLSLLMFFSGIVICIFGISIGSFFSIVMGWLMVGLGVFVMYQKSPEEKEISKIIDVYSEYISKHRLEDRVDKMEVDDPKEFKITLLGMLVHYGEDGLKKELNELKGVVEPEPEAESEPTEPTEEQERRVERDAWYDSELAKEVYDRQSLRQKIKEEKDKVLSQLEKKEISRAEALQTIDDLEKAEQRILKKLEMKGMMDED